MTATSDPFGPKAGLLSCMYEAIYDPETNTSVRNEYRVVLAEYELSPSVQEAALEVSRSNDIKIFGNLLDCLKAEVVDNYENICNRLRRSPSMSDAPFEKPGQGLLAFIYNALYDETINSRIKGSETELEQVIAEFGLTGTPSENLIKELVNSGQPNQELVATLADNLNAEMNANYSTLRQHIW